MKGDNPWFYGHPLINRSLALAKIYYAADSGETYDCTAADSTSRSPGQSAQYSIDISLVTPYLRLTGDGKTPYFGNFREAIYKAVSGAANEAYRNLIRPPTAMSIKEAAYAMMKEAYLKASDNGTLPAKARQIMYPARGEKFDDKRFTQEILPNYINDNPEETADWDVVYDAHGNLSEPSYRSPRSARHDLGSAISRRAAIAATSDAGGEGGGDQETE